MGTDVGRHIQAFERALAYSDVLPTEHGGDASPMSPRSPQASLFGAPDEGNGSLGPGAGVEARERVEKLTATSDFAVSPVVYKLSCTMLIIANPSTRLKVRYSEEYQLTTGEAHIPLPPKDGHITSCDGLYSYVFCSYPL